MKKASITLTEAHHELAHKAIATGEYASLSELIRDAMRDWEVRRKMRDAKLDGLREEIMVGVRAAERGDVVPFDPEDIKRRGRERWASR